MYQEEIFYNMGILRSYSPIPETARVDTPWEGIDNMSSKTTPGSVNCTQDKTGIEFPNF